ncbi:MAG: hypothetical protein A2017_00200 [Lentisphaerae bacterium GWF2_44_16]|nr:MAG: hypothetical protein A2017_00200 [Lentisphaerae bacterium GWF2_44_16]
MKGAITNGKGDLQIREMPMPHTGDYDCLVRIEACVFCNSTDKHIINGTFPFGKDYPGILGHESVGIIEETGNKVRNYKKGQRVLRPYAIYPGEILDGIHSFWGGFAEFGKVVDSKAMLEDGISEKKIPSCGKQQQIVPEAIPFEKMLLMITMKEIYSSVRKINDIKGSNFLIAGAGITACFFGIFLKMAGAGHIAMTARRQAPLDFALANGAADDVFTLDNIPKRKYSALIDTIGNEELLKKLTTSIANEKTVYSYAVYNEMSKNNFADDMKKFCNFIRIDPEEYSVHEEICDMLIRKKFNPLPFVTYKFPFTEIGNAWKTVKNGSSLKTAVLM